MCDFFSLFQIVSSWESGMLPHSSSFTESRALHIASVKNVDWRRNLILFISFTVIVCVMCALVCHCWCVWKSEDSFQELVLFWYSCLHLLCMGIASEHHHTLVTRCWELNPDFLHERQALYHRAASPVPPPHLMLELNLLNLSNPPASVSQVARCMLPCGVSHASWVRNIYLNVCQHIASMLK